MRLVGGPSEYEGIIEICYNGVWGTICIADDWDIHSYFTAPDAGVVCHQLGHQRVGKLLIIVHILSLKILLMFQISNGIESPCVQFQNDNI